MLSMFVTLKSIQFPNKVVEWFHFIFFIMPWKKKRIHQLNLKITPKRMLYYQTDIYYQVYHSLYLLRIKLTSEKIDY